MTVVRPNSISGINSITVATGEALSIHAANGDLVTTLTSSSGIATYKGIHVGSGTTTSNQGVSVGTGASIVSDAVNELSIYTNNTERFNINSSGSAQIGISTFRILAGSAPKIGIGTYTPGYTIEALAASNPTLSIVDTTNAVTTQVRSNSTGALVRTASNHPLVFATNQTERFRITAAGNLGINNTSPNARLEITDTSTAQIRLGYNATKYVRIGRNSSGHYEFFAQETGSPLVFGTAESSDGGGAEKMRIDRYGRVGINTATLTTANAGFDDLVIRSSAGGNTGITLLSSTTAQGTIAFADGGSSTEPYSGYLQYSHSGNTLMLGTNGGDKIRIGSSGEIGVAGAGSLNNGTSGQFLRSGGNSAGCQWADVSGGIDEADIWRLTTSFQGNASGGYIGSNWERADSDGQNHKGTGMSESSGTFTFPSTGFWFVQYTVNMTTQYTPAQPHSHRNTGAIKTTIDNNTYAEAAASSSGIYNYGSNSYPSHGTATCSIIFDVTSTTNCKCRFDWGAGQGSETCMGSTSSNYTFVTFIRLADT